MSEPTRRVTLPDPQRLHYDALLDKAAAIMDRDALRYYHAEEPESHVFFASDMDGFDDPDEAVEIVGMVGERDLGEKIAYWEGAILRGGGQVSVSHGVLRPMAGRRAARNSRIHSEHPQAQSGRVRRRGAASR